jgi:ATP-binding protein involved in chromosome partitioning
VTNTLEGRVIAALSRIQNPRLENDLFSAGMIRDLKVADDGSVTFTFLLGREDPGTLVREARKAVSALEGVRADGVKISVTDPAGPTKTTHGPPQSVAANVPAQTPTDMPALGKVIAISSGKGGVGKSTVAANMAVALAKAGYRVGIMDADVYGPNIPRMFGIFERPPVVEGKIIPLEAHGVKLMSIGFLVDRDAPAIWRGPIIMKIINQFLRDVQWGELDYFLVDMPPGTGDAQLSLVQSIAVTGAVIITTPQEVAVGDALRGAKMFEKVNVPVFGIVENMSPFTDPATGATVSFFGSGGGRRLSEELGVPLMAEVPLQPKLADHADVGEPIMVADPMSPAGQALQMATEALIQRAAEAGVVLPIMRG